MIFCCCAFYRTIVLFLYRVLHVLQQAEIMDVFIDDWSALGLAVEDGDWSGQVSEGLMLFRSLTNQSHTKDKKISWVKWHPTIHGKVYHHSQSTAF